MSDGELVRRSLAGEADSYAELVRRWTARIVALCHAKTGRAGPADDLAQETLLRGFRSLAGLAEPEKFGSWLCGIAAHVCLDWLKHKDRRLIPFSALGSTPDVDNLMVKRQAPQHDDDFEGLLTEVESLAEEYREVIMLYYYDDVTYRDVAGMLGVSTATVNARLTKARALLRERLSTRR